MQFGHFDDAKKEYVITTPLTPFPWINYLGTDDFFSLVSNTAGGYCFYKDARLRRLLRYRYNNVPADSNGRYFYVNDNGLVWSPSWKPCRTDLDFYECRHGMGYTVITGEKNGVRVEVTCFVPRGDNAEIHKVAVRNTGSARKRISLYSAVEFCLWNAYDDMTNYQRNLNTGEVEVEGGVIYHCTEYRERRDHFAFYSVNRPVDGFDSSRDAFLGPYNGFDAPASVTADTAGNSIADGWYPMASHRLALDLGGNEQSTAVYCLGYIENGPFDKWAAPGVVNKQKAKALIAKYADAAAVDAAIGKLRDYWGSLLSGYTVKTHDEKLDRMVNIWNQYQCMVTFNLSRSASFFETGIGRGMGFRDSNQDILGFVHQVPGSARQRLLDLAATQFPDGSSYHQYQPLTKKGNAEIGGNFNDDPLWLILGVCAYVKETGDFTILDEFVPFDNDLKDTATLFDHCKRSFDHVVNNRGTHGLPLIGRADWNDCLNLNCFSTQPDESFQTCTNKDGKTAESVLIAGMFVFIGREYSGLCRQIGKNDEAQRADSHLAAMNDVVQRYGWDGEWFLRAYDDSGIRIGSKECDEGKIFIETQGFCAMAEIGRDSGKPVQALDSLKKYLDTPHGVVLVNPAYTGYRLNLGEISSYPPGYKENAGIFCHNNAWVIIAEAIMGRGDRAFEYYSKIAPAFRERISEIHKMEPYVYSQMIAGKDSKRHGEAKNSWLTGTASWNFVAVSQWILGVRPEYDGLTVDPCIPKEWAGFAVTRKFRGATYEIKVENPSHVCKGVTSVIVDGKKIAGNIVPIFKDNKAHVVMVTMG